jgi:glycosyltransferase involved in cell wall biosynthesis
MIRVGFVIEDNGWLGGLNYFRNLFNAIYKMPDRKIELVIFTGRSTNLELFKDFPSVEIVQTSYLERFHPLWVLHKVGYHFFLNDFFLDRLLRKYQIDLLSHSDYLSAKSSIPTLGWIPDFQCIHFPEFFTTGGVCSHEKRLLLNSKLCSAVVLSSYDAQKDMQQFAPQFVYKSKVLQFVVDPPFSADEPTIKDLEEKYGFNGSYFYVPNQFWVHKNHRIIIDGLKLLKDKNFLVTVVMTGKTIDGRQPEYFGEMMQYAKEQDVLDVFRVLGVVPYRDVVALIKNSVAVMNPSLFEGWHTAVEEAKSLGKRVILSNIPVHIEQNPVGGIYFDPKNPVELADAMQRVWVERKNDIHDRLAEKAREELGQRQYKFAKNYESIVLDTIDQHMRTVK